MWKYLYKNWAYMGPIIAIYVTFMLLTDAALSYPLLLLWLQFPIYALHEFEEHAWPGGFKEFVNQHIFKVRTAEAPLTPARVFWLNISVIWILFPVAALLAQKIHPAFGLFLPCFSLVNATLHIVFFIALRKYNPGLVMSLFLNYPTGLYTLKIAQDAGLLPMPALLGSFLLSIVLHALMLLLCFYWYKQFKKTQNA